MESRQGACAPAARLSSLLMTPTKGILVTVQRTLTRAIVAGGSLMLAFPVVSPAGAAPAAKSYQAPANFKLYLTQTDRVEWDDGDPGTSVFDVVVGSGELRKKSGGSVKGTSTYRAETVRLDIPGGIEYRQSSQSYQLNSGTILTSGLIAVPSGARPVDPQDFAIVGGTGDYSGARGSMKFVPKSPNSYVVKFRFVG